MRIVFNLCAVLLFLAASAPAQSFQKALEIQKGGKVEIRNLYGRVSVEAVNVNGSDKTAEGVISWSSDKRADDSEVKIDSTGSGIAIDVEPSDSNKRIDVKVTLPERTKIRVETGAGEVDIVGNFDTVEAITETGTIVADVPEDDIRYDLNWTTSRPRYVADFDLAEVKERSAGKFTIKGRYPEDRDRKKKERVAGLDYIKGANGQGDAAGQPNGDSGSKEPAESKKKGRKSKVDGDDPEETPTDVELKFTTARGIVVINVPPNEVASDLRERPLTNAAKAIIRSGDSLLMDAIRRASPKYFGDFMRTLPPAKMEPIIRARAAVDIPQASTKRVLVSVFDVGNRTIADLGSEDFEVTENSSTREVISVTPTTAPFNLVLLLDVSGSVDNYVDFIRKAARAFVETVNPGDRVAIVTFNEDVRVLSGFTTDKKKLSDSLDTFDAGGGTAYYDALAFVLADTLRPIRGERTAIVVLTDGDDNRSFLAFDSLIGSIQESGALIYPLYVPSNLMAAYSNQSSNAGIDAMRQKYMGLTTKAEGEGEKLAATSGGIYYPITRLSQIQTAYDDIVRQLRTAYSVTYRSNVAEAGNRGASPRLKVKVRRDNAFVKLGAVVRVEER